MRPRDFRFRPHPIVFAVLLSLLMWAGIISAVMHLLQSS